MKRPIISLVLSGVVCLMFYELSVNSEPFQKKHSISLDVITPQKPTEFKIYWGYSARFSEKRSQARIVPKTANIIKIHFSILEGTWRKISHLRIDPGISEGLVGIKTFSFNGKTWNAKRFFRDFRPKQHIGTYYVDKDTVFIESTGIDPILVKDSLDAEYPAALKKAYFKHRYFIISVLIVFFLLFYLCLGSEAVFILIRGKYPFLIMTFVLMVVCFFSYFRFIICKDLYIFRDIGSDTYYQFWPNLAHTARYLKDVGIPMWSFSHGAGQNIYPATLSVFNPFNALLYLLGDRSIPLAFGYWQVIMVVCGGLVFYAYLRALNLQHYPSAFGGMAYAFSEYMIARGTWYHYTAEGVFFAFLLFAFEHFFKNRRWHYLPIAIFLIAVGYNFKLLVHSIVLFFYALFRCLWVYRLRLKNLLDYMLRFSGLYILGFGLASFVIVPWFLNFILSPRVIGEESRALSLILQNPLEFQDIHTLMTGILRSFSSEILGHGSRYRGVGNYLEGPNYYSGILTLLLIPQALIFLRGKRRGLAIAGFVLTIMYMLFPYLRYIMNGFAGIYFKISGLWITFVWVMLGAVGLHLMEKTKTVHLSTLLTSSIFLVILLCLPVTIKGGFETTQIEWQTFCYVFMFLGLYTVLLSCIKSNRLRPYARWFLAMTVCLEFGLFTYESIKFRNVLPAAYLKENSGYMDDTADAVAFLESRDSGFYRIKKTYHSVFLCDALIQQYRGLESYLSINQSYYLKFLELMGVHYSVSAYIDWLDGAGSRPNLERFLSVNYILTKEDIPSEELHFIKKIGNVRIWEDHHALPLGFAYDRYLPLKEFMKLSQEEKDQYLFKAFTIDANSNLASEFKPLTDSEATTSFENDLRKLKKTVLCIQDHGENHIHGTIRTDRKKLLFFAIPFDCGWTLYLNDKKVDLAVVNMGFMGAVLPVGEYDVRLEYMVPHYPIWVAISFIFLILLLWLVLTKHDFPRHRFK